MPHTKNPECLTAGVGLHSLLFLAACRPAKPSPGLAVCPATSLQLEPFLPTEKDSLKEESLQGFSLLLKPFPAVFPRQSLSLTHIAIHHSVGAGCFLLQHVAINMLHATTHCVQCRHNLGILGDEMLKLLGCMRGQL